MNTRRAVTEVILVIIKYSKKRVLKWYKISFITDFKSPGQFNISDGNRSGKSGFFTF